MAAQEMSGWWSLTSTTKADSARLCSAGAQRHRGWKKAQRWKKSTGGVGKYFTLNITAVYKRCDPGNTSEDYPKYRVSFVCLFLMCLPLLTNRCAPRGTIIDQVVGSGRFLGLHVSP